mmetsp:Transcript_28576/g.93362  ORF Transcript_28576/g.93362 Transcript_28576/m.93362 type:complete len:640 (+) Transcript_28576:117-2036(+)|eukprot:CAMPEP_0170153366 /NCGR_PEP_ID=MMETSP0033_2-20121228/55020_1 /TAXON_ID=195969 /ORGANISM="Dolichomastix tenuilepis, Strain CCMP3274" /LENGTH=639 /DNA_ID=CAMNT_0010390563 /DNA_START=77 /DNA_END=1996 /DNA_ORIENTATION=-
MRGAKDITDEEKDEGEGSAKAAQTKLFVAPFPRSFTEADLWPIFAPYGSVSDVVVLKERGPGDVSRGCAFVIFELRHDALAAVDALDGCTSAIPGESRALSVSLAKKGSSQPIGEGPADNRQLFFARVSLEDDEASVTAMFQRFGDVESVVIFRERGGSRSRGCGFANMKTRQDAEAAKAGLDEQHVCAGMSTPISVRWADPSLQEKRKRKHEEGDHPRYDEAAATDGAHPHAPRRGREAAAAGAAAPRRGDERGNRSENSVLFFGRAPRKITHDGVERWFRKYGDVTEVNLFKNPKGHFKGCGLVTFAAYEHARRAIASMNCKFLPPGGTETITVDWAQEWAQEDQRAPAKRPRRMPREEHDDYARTHEYEYEYAGGYEAEPRQDYYDFDYWQPRVRPMAPPPLGAVYDERPYRYEHHPPPPREYVAPARTIIVREPPPVRYHEALPPPYRLRPQYDYAVEEAPPPHYAEGGSFARAYHSHPPQPHHAMYAPGSPPPAYERLVEIPSSRHHSGTAVAPPKPHYAHYRDAAPASAAPVQYDPYARAGSAAPQSHSAAPAPAPTQGPGPGGDDRVTQYIAIKPALVNRLIAAEPQIQQASGAATKLYGPRPGEVDYNMEVTGTAQQAEHVAYIVGTYTHP